MIDMAQRHLRDAVTSGTFAEILASCHAAQRCLNDARATREVSGPELTREESDVIRREIREGTPDTPERIATMKRADEVFARSGLGAPSGLPTVAQLAAAVRELDVELYGEQAAANVHSDEYAAKLHARLAGA